MSARCIVLALIAASCSDRPPAAKVGASTAQAEWFTEGAREAGLDFVHFNGMTGSFYFAEVIPPGVALLDYDDDGDLDVFLVQGQMLGKKPPSEALHPPHVPLTSRLYRNDLAVHANGTRTLRFADVTAGSGIVVRGYAMGAADGDFDNNGCVDLYVTNLDRSQLFRNNCDGTFTDVSNASGAGSAGWSVSAAFVDYDRDGWLDLFVGHYVQYSVDADKPCLHSIGSLRDYCPPSVYRAQPGPPLSQQPQRDLQRRHRRRRRGTRVRSRRSVSRRPTSTATAGSTSTWPMTVRRTSCGSTGTTARS